MSRNNSERSKLQRDLTILKNTQEKMSKEEFLERKEELLNKICYTKIFPNNQKYISLQNTSEPMVEFAKKTQDEVLEKAAKLVNFNLISFPDHNP